MSSSLAGRANSFKQLQHHLTRFAILSVTKAWLILSRLPMAGWVSIMGGGETLPTREKPGNPVPATVEPGSRLNRLTRG